MDVRQCQRDPLAQTTNGSCVCCCEMENPLHTIITIAEKNLLDALRVTTPAIRQTLNEVVMRVCLDNLQEPG